MSKLFILLLFILSHSLHSQCYEFTYKKTPNLPEDVIASFKGNIPYSKFKLVVNENHSVYSCVGYFPSNSIRNIFDLHYFKDYTNKNVIISDYKNSDRISTIYSFINRQDWKILKGNYKIRGLNCQKAVYFDSGETKTFYYTNDIKLNEGPERYHNLPGFIVKIETVSGIIELESYKLNMTCENNNKIPKIGKNISNLDWEKYLESSVSSFQK